MKGTTRVRSILHLDLDPFFVSVERALDPSLRGQPLIIGGGVEGSGLVASASREARSAGVRAGQSLATAQRLCPEAAVRPGDLERYGQYSDEVTNVLLTASRRIERPSADEAYVDLTRETDGTRPPVSTAEKIKDELQRRLGLDVALGLASSRLAARVASGWARPRGLLVLLPGYEDAFLARQPLSVLPEIPSHIQSSLEAQGIETLGALRQADISVLTALAGLSAATRLHETINGPEPPIAMTAPPCWIQEETSIRDRRTNADDLSQIVQNLATRAARRLRPFDLSASALTVEIQRAGAPSRREESFEPGTNDDATLRQIALRLSEPLLQPVSSVRGIRLRLSRLVAPGREQSLFASSGAPSFARRNAR